MKDQYLRHEYEENHMNWTEPSTEDLRKIDRSFDLLKMFLKVVGGNKVNVFGIIDSFETISGMHGKVIYDNHLKLFNKGKIGIVKPYSIDRQLLHNMHDSYVIFKGQMYMVVSQGILDDKDNLDVSIGLFKNPTLSGIGCEASHERMSVERFLDVLRIFID